MQTVSQGQVQSASILLGMTEKELLEKLTPKPVTPEPQNKSLVFTVPESAEMVKCSQRQVFRFIKEGRLDSVHYGRRCLRIPAKSLMKFIKTGISSGRKTVNS